MVRKLLITAKIFGFVPLCSLNDKLDTLWTLFLLVFHVVRSSFHILTVANSYELTQYFMVFQVLSHLQFIFQCLFLGVSSGICIKLKENFVIFLGKLLTERLQWKKKRTILLLMGCHLLYSVILVIELKQYLSDGFYYTMILHQWTYFQSIQYLQLFFSVFIYTIAYIITRKYVKLKKKLEKYTRLLIIYRNIPSKYIKEKLKPVKTDFVHLYELVGEFNLLFNRQILLVIIGIPLNTMTGFAFALRYKSQTIWTHMAFACQIILSKVGSIQLKLYTIL